MRTRQLIAIIGTSGVLASCGGTDDGGGGGGESGGDPETTPVANGSPPQAGPSSTALAEAFAMIGHDDTEPASATFIHQSRINALAEEWEPWREVGTDPFWTVLSALPMPDMVMGVDPKVADTILHGGGVRLLNGGQDVERISMRADDPRWEGELPLLNYIGDQPNVSTSGLQVLVRGNDSAATGYRDTDMSVVDAEGPTLADNAVMTELRECLGDPVKAVFRPGFAYGVVPGEEGPYTVVCSLHPDSDAAEEAGRRAADTVGTGTIDEARSPIPHAGNSDPFAQELTGAPYSDYFGGAEYSVADRASAESGDAEADAATDTGALLRTVLPHRPDVPPSVVFYLNSESIPGLADPE